MEIEQIIAAQIPTHLRLHTQRKRTDTEPFQPIINLSRMLAKHPVSLIAAGS
jgi:hypothetical protein